MINCLHDRKHDQGTEKPNEVSFKLFLSMLNKALVILLKHTSFGTTPKIAMFLGVTVDKKYKT